MSSRKREPRSSTSLAKRIVWTEEALADLDAIGAYIGRDDGRDDGRAAARWVGMLMAAAEKAARFPMAGRRVPEIDRDDVREVLVRTYRVVYWIHDEHIELLTVFEGHRLLRLDRITP